MSQTISLILILLFFLKNLWEAYFGVLKPQRKLHSHWYDQGDDPMLVMARVFE